MLYHTVLESWGLLTALMLIVIVALIGWWLSDMAEPIERVSLPVDLGLPWAQVAIKLKFDEVPFPRFKTQEELEQAILNSIKAATGAVDAQFVREEEFACGRIGCRGRLEVP